MFLRRHRWIVPYALLTPGLLWLAAFYVWPAVQMFVSSFWSGSVERGFTFSLENWTTYPDALDRYSTQFQRSVLYAGAATILTFMIASPPGLRDRVPRRAAEEPPAVPRRRAVLHQLPAPDDQLEDHPRR
ncbi:MAG: hypothetical protein M5U05_19315 [Anaerolineales bacterium]|nr:hypothetical protein [Anaerolineales bacterium]